MTASIYSLPAILFYFVTWLLIFRCVRLSISTTEKPTKSSKWYFITWLLALVLHIVSLHFPLLQNKPLTLNLISLVSYVMWFLSLILFLITLRRKIQSLAIIILPFTIFSILLTLLPSNEQLTFINMKSGLGIHVLVSLLAYSVLMLASFQAIVLASQNNHLHSHQTSGFIRTLPSLEDMEYLLFRLIAIGVILLTLSLLSGFYYLDDMFAQHVAHKTILSIIAWIIFTALLIGRWRYGWRGKTAVRWTLSGFLVLMLAFFGTKFVQEFILTSNVS